MIKNSRRRRLIQKRHKADKLGRQYRAALDQLEAECLLTHNEGTSYAEIGKVLGVTRQRVHQMVAAAQKHIHVTSA